MGPEVAHKVCRALIAYILSATLLIDIRLSITNPNLFQSAIIEVPP